MEKRILLAILSIIILQSCSPYIRTKLSNTNFQPLQPESEIFIVKENESIPENSDFIGDLIIDESGFSNNCNYTKVIDYAKEEAKKSGANFIQLTDVKGPNFESTCYRIKAKLYRNLDPVAVTQILEKNTSRLPPNADYAVIYFYRPKTSSGSLIGIKIRMDKHIEIGNLNNGEKFEYKVTYYGKYEFWSKTESKTSVIIDVEKGQEYFIRCGINMGILVGRPEMYLVNNELGISEYEQLEKK